MRTIKTTTGIEITLDGDLLAILETLYREVTARRELERTFEDMLREITFLIDQMDESERRTYLTESLFLNTVKYENDKLEAYMRKITRCLIVWAKIHRKESLPFRSQCANVLLLSYMRIRPVSIRNR